MSDLADPTASPPAKNRRGFSLLALAVITLLCGSHALAQSSTRQMLRPLNPVSCRSTSRLSPTHRPC